MNNTEKKTVQKMIHIFCAAKHNDSKSYLCPDCEDLNKYASTRLDRCKFGEEKPNCQKCPIHCYKSDMRKRIQEIMKFSGPRIFFYSPRLGILHLIKGLRK